MTVYVNDVVLPIWAAHLSNSLVQDIVFFASLLHISTQGVGERDANRMHRLSATWASRF